MVLPPAVRPLSSADEMGPVAKKLRTAARKRVPPSRAADSNHIKPSKSAGATLEGADDRSKSSKARARPALTIANIFSSPGRRVQDLAMPSRSNAAATSQAEQRIPPPTFGHARRSSRLQTGANSKASKLPVKVSGPECGSVPANSQYLTITSQIKERRRVPVPTRSTSESEMDDEPLFAPRAASPGPEGQGSSGVAAQQSQAAQDAYEMELADYAIYNLMRMCASAMRALAMYECRACLEALERLPVQHQRSAWVMAMVGKAHYETGEYSAVSAVDRCLPPPR